VKSFEDFAKIQPLTREHIKSNYEALKSRVHDKNALIVGQTSGSSGTPMIFYYDKETYSAGRAAVLMGWELAGKKMGDKLITIWGGRSTVEGKWTTWGSRLKAKLYRNRRITSYILIDESKINEALDLMSNRRDGFVYGYTNAIYELASYAKEHKIRLERRFDGILTTAESLFPFQRNVIEEVFGPVYDGYGCQEILGIAFQCQEKKGYHVVEPNVIFETEQLVDETNEIIVTDLWNYAWPLIRYKPGDLVSGEIGHGCPCGCTWSTLAKINGRATDIITAPDGTRIYSVIWDTFALLLANHPYIKQFQWSKVAQDKLVLRLLLQNEPGKAIKDKIKTDLAPYFEGVMELRVEFVDKFEVGPSGKHKVIVDETK
jgi:phenylacetate-CoA ligase